VDPFSTAASEAGKVRPDKTAARKQTRYRAVSAIAWRGGGGIFRALDVKARRSRPCLMKEGLRHGNIGCDGIDGFQSVRNEAKVLTILRGKNVRVPRVHAFFCQGGNSYLVQDFIEGKTLAEVVDSEQLSLRKKTEIARQICEIVSRIHAAGWTWRDIKLGNFLYDGRKVWAIDMEFAMPIRSRKLRSFRGTAGYFREAPDVMTGQQALMIDRYALGVTLQRLFGGASERSRRYGKRLPGIPGNCGPNVTRIVKALRNKQPERRPGADEALACLAPSKRRAA
jgi:serine/threonine-protein kinase